MSIARRAALSLSTLLLIAPVAHGQEAKDPADAPLALGRAALAEGEREAALRHLLRALEMRPGSREILELLLAAASESADAHALFVHDWYAAVADRDGRAKTLGEERRLLGDDAAPARVALTRAAAVAELLELAEDREKKGAKAPEHLVVALWARRTALELAAGVAALEERTKDESAALVVPRGFHRPVLGALEKAIRSALAARDTGLAMRAARCLHGMAAQADFKDLQGPAPSGMSGVRRAAAEGLARAREQLAERVGEPWTVEELEWLSLDEGEAFTREHSSFALPGVAVSPREWYRVETDCGVETLLGVALTVEAHHTRLVNWYGQDPFTKRQGTVRIVPEAHGLEAEGAPFWWAGGFQGGDTTTLRFACGTIEGLGHGLTHELTHRFDGAIYPGQPAWLVEGKAVWTGAAYAHSSDESFVENHCSLGTIEGVFIKGYGGYAKLKELIDGSLEEYRDNYSAGYALYVYLKSWRADGDLVYADQLRKFMEGGLGGKDQETRFVGHFADGKRGRPDGLEEFAAAFGAFIKGFYWKDRKEWTRAYTQDVGPGRGSELVYDEPTWVWSRNRAEPVFGQDQARLAGEILHEARRDPDALRALVWALATDGRDPRVFAPLAAVLEARREKHAVWALAALRATPWAGAEEPAPFQSSLHATKAYLGALGAAADAYSGSGRRVAAAAMSAEHARLAARIGAAARPPVADVTGDLAHPFDPPGHHAGTLGWVEDGLTGYEERRAAGKWYAAADGDLHVGREEPRRGTGRMDRAAHQRDAFTRTREWLLPGAYRLRTRVQFTTSYVSGAVILGYTRRDRNVRLQFTAGDFMFAIGENEEEPTFEEMSFRLHGLFERDGALPGSQAGGGIEFGRPRGAFDLELVVDGATVHAFIDGERRGVYTTPNGEPIEGYVGFATSHGAVRVQKPVVERLDRSAGAGRLDPDYAGLDLAHEGAAYFPELRNRPVRGIASSSNGTLVLWIPVPEADEGDPIDLERLVRNVEKGAQSLARLVQRTDATQPAVLAVPGLLGEETLTTLARELAQEHETELILVPHAYTGAAPDGTEDPADRNRRWLLFLDAGNVARVVQQFFGEAGIIDGPLGHWLQVFRDHGRPPRDLPEVVRGAGDDEELGEDE